MMKLGVLVACSTLFVVAPAMAAMEGNSCVAKSKQVKASERDAFMKKCLADISSPANVKEVEHDRKRSVCEQNAKNLKEQGADKNQYINECMNKNEAATVAAEVAATAPAAAPAPAKQAAPKPVRKVAAAHKSAKACAQEANKKGLKGDARKQFLKTCQAG